MYPRLATNRIHLQHLILSHHGHREWGSPVEPSTPEAVLLHQADMMAYKIEIIDAKMSYTRAGYEYDCGPLGNLTSLTSNGEV